MSDGELVLCMNSLKEERVMIGARAKDGVARTVDTIKFASVSSGVCLWLPLPYSV